MDTENTITYEQRARVGRLLNQVQKTLVAAIDKDLEPLDVSVAQYAILSMLWSGSANTAAQLCKEIGYSPGAMTRMLDRLEQKRMIRRLPYPGSRRVHLLALTEEGQEVFPELLARASANVDHLLGIFDSADLNRLEALLSRMLAHE